MNYIILDMEWDSTFFSPEQRFINQIIQIGAVKLDESLNIIDTFEETVKSAISKSVTGRFSRLTGITSDMMRAGIPLEEAVNRYNAWIGTDTVTMTWSNSDLYSVMENEKTLLDGVKFRMEKYLDLQSFVQNEMRLLGFEITSQLALGRAAEMLGIITDNLDLHTAKDDSLVCAALLKKCYNKNRFEALIKDTRDQNFYKRLSFKPYYINNISDKVVDKSYFKFLCDKCGAKMRRKTAWEYRNRWFVAEFCCRECGNVFSGRVSIRKTYDDVIVKKRICPPKRKREDAKENEMQPLPENV